MKINLLRAGLLAGLATMAISCSMEEFDLLDVFQSGDRFYARIESVHDQETKVYADYNLRVLWDADDHVSIFNKYTYNQEYRFTGKTGDNSGSFKIVPNDDFITGNELNLVYAVYPYQESTSIDNDGVLTVTLPAVQTYREASFGRGANTMVSCTTNNQLLFKNLGGYLCLKLYGDGVSVSSISIKGNKNESLAGEARVVATPDDNPTLDFLGTATDAITLEMEEPVTLGASASEAISFWMVIPPVTFEEGFTITVTDQNGGVFTKSTTKSFSISRNTLSRMSALQVTINSVVDPTEMPLAVIAGCEDGTVVKTTAVQVMAMTTLGVIVADESQTMLLFSRTPLDVSVGDRIQVIASKTTYRNLPELQEIQSLDILSTGETVIYPTPVDISALSDFEDPFFGNFQYVLLRGTFQSYKRNAYGVSYYVLRNDDPSLLPFYFFYPSDYQIPHDYLLGDEVWATGYFAGFNTDSMCIILTSMTVAPAGSYLDEYGVNQGEGITINGITWAPVNCGYKPATAESKGYPYGKLYQYGRKDGQGYGSPYYSTSTYEDESTPELRPQWTGSNEDADPQTFYYGSSEPYNWISTSAQFWNDGTDDSPLKNKLYDPCPKGWRVPTAGELSMLLSTSRSELTEYDDVRGVWLADQLFLPAGGGRFADMWAHRCGANGRGEGVNYWSSSLRERYAVTLDLFSDRLSQTYKAFGFTVRCVKDIASDIIPVSDVILEKSEIDIPVGSQEQLIATVSPMDATYNTLIWSSSNDLVATVSGNGIISANREGSAIITVTATNGNYAKQCQVTVVKTIPRNQIWYTSCDGEVINPVSGTSFFNAEGEELSYTNTKVNDKWVMEFSDKVAYWTGNWFHDYPGNTTNRLKTLGLPSSIQGGKFAGADQEICFYEAGLEPSIELFYGDYEGIADDGHLLLIGEEYSIVLGCANAYNGTITVPEGVTLIHHYGFHDSQMSQLILPSTIAKLDLFCLEACQHLTDIFCYAPVCPETSSSIWTYVYTTGTLHYPVDSDYSDFHLPSGWTRVGDL
jgi:uncharacterized protein (TIGR02145 family)